MLLHALEAYAVRADLTSEQRRAYRNLSDKLAAAAPSPHANGVTYDRIERLMHAVEGECDGLGDRRWAGYGDTCLRHDRRGATSGTGGGGMSPHYSTGTSGLQPETNQHLSISLTGLLVTTPTAPRSALASDFHVEFPQCGKSCEASDDICNGFEHGTPFEYEGGATAVTHVRPLQEVNARFTVGGHIVGSTSSDGFNGQELSCWVSPFGPVRILHRKGPIRPNPCMPPRRGTIALVRQLTAYQAALKLCWNQICASIGRGYLGNRPYQPRERGARL